MTELEQLAVELWEDVTSSPGMINAVFLSKCLNKLTTAYNLGKHDAYANQRTAARENGKKGGRKEGSKDTKPRPRRSKAEVQEVKP